MESTRKKTIHSACYEIHLKPTVIFHNILPVTIHVLAYGTTTEIAVSPGQSCHLTAVELGTFVVLKVTPLDFLHFIRALDYFDYYGRNQMQYLI